MERKYDYVQQNHQPTMTDCITRTENSLTEIAKPKFFVNYSDMHPRDFLNRLEAYFAIKQTYVGQKIIVVGDCLNSVRCGLVGFPLSVSNYAITKTSVMFY